MIDIVPKWIQVVYFLHNPLIYSTIQVSSTGKILYTYICIYVCMSTDFSHHIFNLKAKNYVILKIRQLNLEIWEWIVM